MTITITGRITYHQASSNLSDLRIEAWDAYLNLNEPVASTFTDVQGTFQIQLDEAYLQGLFSQQQPELYFKVFRGDELMANTQHSLIWHPGDEQTELVIEIGNSAIPTPQPPVRPPDLKRLALDEATQNLLSGKGYSNVAAIASASMSAFVTALRGDLGDFKAAQVHVMARAQEDMLKNIATAQLVSLSNGRTSLFSPRVADTVTPCDCPDCNCAISPQAYLADLLVYTIEHVEQAVPPPPITRSIQQNAPLASNPGVVIPRPRPSISPNGGIFSPPVWVTLTFANIPPVRNLGSYKFIYTLDGSPPVPNGNPPFPSAPVTFPLTQSARVRAIVVGEHGFVSDETDAVFTIFTNIDVPFLSATLCQPFGDLPTSCEAADETVHQVRLCIEALRRYQQNPGFPPTAADALNQANTAYCMAAYTTILAQLGTSYQELQLARAADASTRQSLADRLGIEPDNLDALLLIPDSTASADTQLNEQNLERLFGLVDTTRDPLAGGLTFNDAQGQLTRWRLEGVNWGANTDLNGKIYASVSKVSVPRTYYRVDLFSDSNRTLAVARGVCVTSTGRVKLVEANQSGLSGSLDLSYSADDATIEFQVIPEFTCWQFQRLRTLWLEEDWPADAYSDNALPIIDPDLIGPDDFRKPVPSGSSTITSAFDIWVERRNWMDGRLAALSGVKKAHGTPDMDGLLLAMTPPPNGQPITYVSTTLTSWPTITTLAQLDTLFSNLLQGVSVPATIQQVEQDLGLQVDSFTRLMDLRVKDQLSQSDPRNPAVTETEWQEVYSILAQAQKVKFFPTWIAEEQTKKVNFDSSTFWISISEPKVGEWPPSQGAEQPLIDPELLKLSDLPDPVAGQHARSIWGNRKAQLAQDYAGLQQTREQSGLQAALLQALGDPRPGDPLPHNDNLDQLASDLQSNDHQKVAAASATITSDLYMSVDSFNQFMAIRAKDQQADPLLKPTAAEWSECYAILTSAQKRKRRYPAWLTEEQNANLAIGIVYWQALKARLPLWRSSEADRQAWQQVLLTRSAAPLIDPDLIDASYIRTLSPPNPALPLFNTRSSAVTTLLNNLQSTRPQSTNIGLLQQWFDQNVYNYVGLHTQDLVDLDNERQQGNDIAPRLAQLGLSYAAFTYLAQMNSLLANNILLLDSEWMAVYSILAQAWKEQQFDQWRQAEQAPQQLTLSPDFFQLTLNNGIPTARQLPDWRATSSALSDWQGTLLSRQGERQACVDTLSNAVSVCEEATLPQLRDALIMAYDPTQTSLDVNAAAVMQRFLIDAEMAGNQQTTRIEQAIETIQNLLFSLRTAAYPNLVLNDWEDFDQSWQWLGTYASWSAALRVFLYPENILQPTLRNWQSAGFEKLVGDIRSSQQMSPKQAREAAQTYLEYFQDMCSLVVDATCYANTLIQATQEQRSLFYMFAHSSQTNNLYWSAWDPQDSSGYAQTSWQPLPGLDRTFKIIGAVPYTTVAVPPQHFIYLVASSPANGQPVFVFTRYNLDAGNWDPQRTQLELPVAITPHAEMVVTQSTSEGDSPGVILWTGTGANLHQLFFFDSGGNATNQWESIGFIAVPPVLLHLCASLPHSLIIAQDVNKDLYVLYDTGSGYSWSKIGTKQFFVGAFNWTGSTDNYVFTSASPGSPASSHMVVSSTNGAASALGAPPFDLVQFAFSAGSAPGGEVAHYACQLRGGDPGPYHVTFKQTANKSLIQLTKDRLVPYVSQLFEITELLSSQQLQARRALEQQMFQDNTGASESVLGYLREAHYFVPLYLAQQLQQGGEYTSALDWYRVVYDYSQPEAQRKIYYGLEAEEASAQGSDYLLGDEWLLDPLNPHAIAATRSGTYTRFTLRSLIGCFLDYADAEYTRDTSESVSLARTLYTTAQSLLAAPDLQQGSNACSAIIGELTIAPDDAQVASALAEIKRQLASIASAATLRELVPQIRSALAATRVSSQERLSQAQAVVEAAILAQPAAPTLGTALAEQGKRESVLHTNLLQNQAVLQSVSETGSAAGAAFLQEVASIAKVSPTALLQQRVQLPWFSQNGASSAVITLADTGDGSSAGQGSPVREAGEVSSSALVSPRLLQQRYVAAPPYQFCIPANTVLQSLGQRSESALAKIRSGRNIAGLKRQLQLTTSTGITTVGGQGQVVTFQPTPYRYTTLVERAKQLAQLANQVEAAMLAALEKRDNEQYSLLKARQDLGLATATLLLQQLKVSEANDGVTLAQLQKNKAQSSFDYYSNLLSAGLTSNEKDQISALSTAKDWSDAATWTNIGLGALELVGGAIATYASGGAGVGLLLQGASTIAGAVSSQASHENTMAALSGVLASYERRTQEWTQQQQLASQDIQIGQQQISIAQDGVGIAGQERAIAQSQANNATVTVNFLATKFTNADLYDWMSQVLARVYRFFLQQATAMAQQASNQLAFERAETPPPFIQSDYWQPPSSNTSTGGGSLDGTSTDRKGLTGSARLLKDIYQLDQYAFTTDQRRLQLTKTLSLATLAPAEFQRFRESGVMVFATPMRLFDADFPGHYLRQIQQVRTSVIALIPPNQGIHASLSSTGVSRVVVGGDSFQTVVVIRDPETVALSSPANATGVFELTAQSQSTLLNPFEDSGVDMSWELSMPRASNLFDYSTIADVLISIDYTALESAAYRQQVVRQLDRTWSADLPYSFRQQFADQWYDLNNPDQSSTPMVVSFTTLPTDFPPNLTDLKIQQVVLCFTRAEGQSFEIPITSLFFAPQNGRGRVGGGATSIDGVISTRRGNADSWLSMIGKLPAGTWELTLPDTDEIRKHFQNEEITDILFVLTYQGRTPSWPG